MAVDFNKVRKILNSANGNVINMANGSYKVKDSNNFHGMSMSKVEEAKEMIAASEEQEARKFANKCGRSLDTLDSITNRAERNVGVIIDSFQNKKDMSKDQMKKILDSGGSAKAMRDSILNPRTNIGTPNDPSLSNILSPNVYISPYQANALYSQKGIFETIINKKAKSILLNGLNIKNSHLSQKQIDLVKESTEKLNLKHEMAKSLVASLCYGGSLLFPMFKGDNAATVTLPLSSLLKLGVLKKDCLDYFISLDRWNTFILPPTNPTEKNFYTPERYIIPFLGSDVHHTRCARVVTAEQAGYWGAMLTQGWGLSDMCGYLQSGMNYKVAVQSIPLMIQQMSILARTINVDGILATEGANALDSLVDEDTVRTREASPDNPITMDVLGDIKSIDRNFGQVPELIRLLRQDLASDATIPEPMLFSSEKGNFSSGDDTEGNLAKQWESVKMIHIGCEPQFKQIAKIMVVNALGASDEVIRALPYTEIHFDEPVIANALERAEIGKFFSENVFNLVSAQVPVNEAVKMASQHIASDLAPSSEILDELKAIQDKVNTQDDERTKLENEKAKAEIDQIKENTKATKENAAIQKSMTTQNTVSSGKTKVDEVKSNTKGTSPAQEQREKARADRKETGYSRLEQKKHEKARLGTTQRKEKLQKSKNKAI